MALPVSESKQQSFRGKKNRISLGLQWVPIHGELASWVNRDAITIHKPQGSEFPAVVIPLATQQYMLLQRNLVYTGITCGKRLVVLIGSAEGTGNGGEKQQDGEPVFRASRKIDQASDPINKRPDRGGRRTEIALYTAMI